MKTSAILAGLLVASTMATTACIVHDRTVEREDGTVVQEDYVEGIAPPPLRVEVVPPLPYPDGIWIGGGWFHEGRHWVWHRGHYEHHRR